MSISHEDIFELNNKIVIVYKSGRSLARATNDKFLFNWWIIDKDPSLRWRSVQDDRLLLGSSGGVKRRVLQKILLREEIKMQNVPLHSPYLPQEPCHSEGENLSL